MSKIFAALGMESTPVPIIPEEFAKMLFTLNPDVFGNRLENAERWLQECVERADQEREKIRKTNEKIPRRLPDDHSALILFAGMRKGKTI